VGNECGGQDLREVWQAQPEMERRMSAGQIQTMVTSMDRERRRRSVGFMASGAVIVPSWLAVAWSFPDFRLLAGIGVGTALWILYHVYRDTAASRVPVGVMPNASLPFYRTLLEREQRYHRRLPWWFLPPVILSTAAVAVTFYRSARFAHTPVFLAVMVWIIMGAAVALVIGVRKSRREADRCQREMDELEK
jgi:hypothetical protein